MSAQHPVRRRVVALVVLLGSASALHAAAPPALRSLEDCEALVRGQPPKPSAWRCFWWVARSTGQSAEAARRLKAHLHSDPGNPAILLNLGRTESDQGLEDARPHMEAAIGLFQRQGSQEGEFASRLALAFFCGLRKDHECEQSQFPRLEHIAEATGNADFKANVLLHESHHAGHEADYARALSLMKQAQAVPLPEGPYYLKGHILSGLVGIYMTLGMYQEGFAAARLQVAHVRQTGDIFELASALHNLSLLAGYDPEGTGVQAAERLAITQEALDTALRSGNTRAEGLIRLSLSQELSFSLERRLDEAAKALELGRRAQVIPQVCFALRRLAQLEFMKGRSWEEAALELADQAIETARVSGDLFHIARGWIVRASLGWVHGDHERALADSLRALDAVERIRDLQPDELVRTRLSAQWTMPYYRFSGQALERALAGDEAYLDAGFMMMERLRGRVLLGAMDAMRITEEIQPGGDAAARRRGILDRIAGMQKVLMGADQPPEETRRLLADLEGLEAQEAASRSELAASDDRWSTLRNPRAPALEEVQRALAPDEALLVFQVASDETDEETTPLMEGGSWLLVVTRGGIRIEKLPSRRKLGPEVALYEALIQRRDGSDLPGGVALYQAVLAGGLRGLPGEVRRLIVIPDDVLYHLSFDALRPHIGAPALGEQFEISIAPSATLWMRWRTATVVAAPRAVLALADPDLPAAGPAPGALRQTTIAAATMARPGRLPRARREAAAVAGMIGGDSQTLSGAAASESLLKHADLSRFGMLHLAAHAVMDAQRPERSAVLLAAGDPREDGLLQMRDVVGLPLQGRAVMLAACDSSSGALARGEGVMSLARAFFQAGATAVVGSLWPLRDDEAEQFVSPLYSRLAQGDSIAGALAATRRELIASRAPTAAWAGMVVLGDGGMVPFAAAPGSVAGGAAGGASSWGIAAGAALLMTVSAVALLRRRRRA